MAKRNYGICVDLGATNLRVALGFDDGRLIAKLSRRTDVATGPEAISRQIIEMVKTIRVKCEALLGELVGIGIGSIGPLDPKRGGIDHPANLPYDFIPLVEPLNREFNVPVELLNDCVAAVLGEKTFGLGKLEHNLVYITISTGIGAGVYVDNHLLLGKDGNAHEVGHMVIDSNGRLRCGCGRAGHWEAYTSGRNLPNLARMLVKEEQLYFSGSLLSIYTDGDFSRLTAKDIYHGAATGDKICLRVIEEAGRLNAIGFSNVVNVYDPSLITVGGTVALENVSLVLDPIQRYLAEYCFNRPPKIQATPLGEDIVLYGALASSFGAHRTEGEHEGN
ncbi:MAG: ROK family protein [Candidatus Bathyarchaeia archaeon]